MNDLEFEVDRVDLRLHQGIYQWSARQFDPGWVLDVGTELGVGMGLMQDEDPHLKVLGCDVKIAPLKASRTLIGEFGQRMAQADAAMLPIASRSMTGVCLINILHLVDRPQMILDESRRVLKRRGRVVVYIDLSKLPLWHEAERLEMDLDDLLGNHFRLMTPHESLTSLFNRLRIENTSVPKLYLRLGEKN
ncbi:MAG: methyltransferase domain-containing protein [Anaerolineales bacterium]|jgi:ubiquinone/menaquinone biosynthesis C-methylase UbiE